MTKTSNILPDIDLQLFAEGSAGAGEGGTGAEGGQSGVSVGASLPTSKRSAKNPLASVVYGKQEDTSAATASQQTTSDTPNETDRNAAFEALIKGDYKDLYDARVQDTIQKRLKGTKETVDRYNALTPTLELLAKKYGVKDVNDIEALNKAIEDDDSYWEDEALEKGITVDQLKSIRKMEKENEQLKAQMRDQQMKANADRTYAKWMQDSDALKGVYPSFDLQAELQNPNFVNLLKSNVDVRTAYEVIHKDEIIPAAMAFTQKKTMEQMSNAIIANQKRPAESGLSKVSPAVYKSDVSQLTKADRAEIARRVARGERITF